MDLFSRTALPALGEAWSADLLQPEAAGLSRSRRRCMGLAVGVFPGLGGIAGLSAFVLPFMFGMEPVLRAGPDDRHGRRRPDFGYLCLGAHGHPRLLRLAGHGARRLPAWRASPAQAARALSAAFASSLFGGLLRRDLILTMFILDRPTAGPGLRPARDADDHRRWACLDGRRSSPVAVCTQGPRRRRASAWHDRHHRRGPCGRARLRMATYDILVSGQDGLQAGDRRPRHLCRARNRLAAPPGQDQSIAKGARLGAGWLARRAGLVAPISVAVDPLFASIGVHRRRHSRASAARSSTGSPMATRCSRPRTSRQFGKGEVRGVIGPESSNNAKEGGGLVPTLLFGIPGSGSMADLHRRA